MEFQRDMPKFEKKCGFSRDQCENMENSRGVMIKYFLSGKTYFTRQNLFTIFDFVQLISIDNKPENK